MIVNARLITLATLITFVSGQTASQCVLACSQAAFGSATNKSCKSITDTCVCTDAGFQAAASQCLQKNCTSQDQQAAAQLQKVLCGSGSSNSTNSTSSASQSSSSTATGSAATTSQSSSSTATGSAATTSQSSAADAQIQAGQTGLFALGIAAAGAIVGGLLI